MGGGHVAEWQAFSDPAFVMALIDHLAHESYGLADDSPHHPPPSELRWLAAAVQIFCDELPFSELSTHPSLHLAERLGCVAVAVHHAYLDRGDLACHVLALLLFGLGYESRVSYAKLRGFFRNCLPNSSIFYLSNLIVSQFGNRGIAA